MRDTDLERLKRDDPESVEIIDLMLAENERELSEFEARRVQQFVEQSPVLQEFLNAEAPENAGQDNLWDQVPVALPSDAEWRQVDVGLHQAIGRADAEKSSEGDRREPAGTTSRSGVWATVAALAATLLFAFILVEQYSGPSTPSETASNSGVDEGSGSDPEVEEPMNEVIITELPDDVLDVQIDDVEGALMIYVSSG